jgi:hypothetical protein
MRTETKYILYFFFFLPLTLEQPIVVIRVDNEFNIRRYMKA